MKKNILSFIGHLSVFIIIEILFVFLILREFPQVSLLGIVGVIHLSYWIVIILAGVVRQKLTRYRQRFLADYIPVLFHIAGHIYISIVTVETVVEQDHIHGQEHSILWMVIATIALGILIFIGEWLLHKKEHCDVCHSETHKHCV